MTKEEIVQAAMAHDAAADEACGPEEQLFILDAGWAYKVAYLMLLERADLLPTTEDLEA